jgi:copper transport protein
MRRRAGVLLAVLAGVLLALLPAGPASAHTVLVGSDPADGSRLASSPASVTLRFNEQVGLELGYLRVVDPSGRRVDSGPASHPGGDGSKVSVALRPGLGDGSYLASYRVISADSHPVAGSIRYVVGDGALQAGSGASGSAPVNQVVSTGLATSHWLGFAGVAMAGGSWLVFTLWPAGRRRRAIRRLVWTGWSLAGLGAITEYLVEGPYESGTGPGSIVRTDLLDATLHSETGQFLSLRVLLLGILGMVLTVLLRDGRGVDEPDLPSWGPGAAAGVGLGIVVTFAATGHTQSTNPHELWMLVDALHLSAMIVWLGGVLVLLVAAFSRGARVRTSSSEDDPAFDAAVDDLDRALAVETDREQLSTGLPVFSRVAMACIATLAVTGTLQAWREVGAWDALASTRYGQLVLVKVALFCAILGLGYLARRAVLRSTARPATEPGPPLEFGLPAEAVQPTGSGQLAGSTQPGSGQAGASGQPGGVVTMLSPPAPAPSRSGLPARLTRTLLVEVAIGALVLAATAVLVSQPPGKVALAAERSKPRHATVQINAATQAAVDVTPGVHGDVRIAVRLAGGTPPTGITATASLPAQKLGPIPVPLQSAGPGSYTSSDVLLPVAGTWELTLTVQTSEFDSTVAVARVKVS